MNSPHDDSAASRPVYETDLAKTPLPEMLVTIYRHKAPGTIDCHRGNERKEIYLDRGHIVFATSNQVRDSLGDRLLNEGLITREQYDESVRRLLSTPKRQGTILTEMHVLEPDRMLEAVRDQLQEIVWSVFGWDGGRVGFVPGRDRHREFVKLDIPIPQAIIEGVRHIPDAKQLLARIGTRTTILERTGEVVPELSLDEDETHLLEQAGGGRSLAELVNTPPLAPGVNARLLYAFTVMNLVAPKEARRVRVQVDTRGGQPRR